MFFLDPKKTIVKIMKYYRGSMRLRVASQIVRNRVNENKKYGIVYTYNILSIYYYVLLLCIFYGSRWWIYHVRNKTATESIFVRVSRRWEGQLMIIGSVTCMSRIFIHVPCQTYNEILIEILHRCLLKHKLTVLIRRTYWL